MPGKKKKEEVVSNEGALAPKLPEPEEGESVSPETVSSESKETSLSSDPLPTHEKPSKMNMKRVGIVILILAVVAVIASIPALYFYTQYKQMQTKLNPTAAAQAHVSSLLAQVGKLMLLPANEVPTVYQVTDISKLKNEAFFFFFLYGDEVLIYGKARKAIIYRPSTRKIVNVGPVNIQAAKESANSQSSQAVAGASTSATLSPTPVEVKVALYNGTDTSGLTRQAEPLVIAASSGVKVSAKENAAKTDYVRTQVVVLNKNASVLAEKVASAVNGEVITTLPEGEVRPAADILVILGTDFVE